MAKTEKSESIEEKKDYPAGNERILLVDDEAPVVNLEKQMLERLGYRVAEYASSFDALKAFKAGPSAFDLVISDLSMPNLTGDQLAHKLIAIRPDIPIIICTGFSERIDQEKAASIGVSGFLMKPIIKAEMAKIVRKVLDGANT
jgi:two-component system cell cycle sensor histidine kinase/response regulator CckA